MASSPLYTVYLGNIIHSITLTKVEYKKVIVINNKTNKIELLLDNISELSEAIKSDSNIIDNNNKLIIPGFIDTHAHAPQYAFVGTGRIPLLEWLLKYTFPTESKFNDLEYAKSIYSKSVKRHLSHGTTTICYYGTIHSPATLLLADIVAKSGQRGFIGKVCMDRNSPDFYIETTESSLKDTQDFVNQVLAMKNEYVQPIITPRFAPTCTSELMNGLAKIADADKLLVQTHVSENIGEIAWVSELHPECDSYCKVYDNHGLLSERTILAHAIHLLPSEIELLKAKNVGISHCPNSNFSLKSGILNSRKILEEGIKCGLGTDVAGGYSPSILNAIRESLIASNALYVIDRDVNKKDTVPLSVEEAFYLATLGGADLVGMKDKVGNFAVGKEFDALIVNPYVADSPFDLFGSETLEDIFHKFLFLGDDRSIESIFVNNRKVK